jgi:hypothetical protein
MAEFHITDKVCVLYAGRPIQFEINQITTDAKGNKLYSGEGTGWWPQERLDYAITGEEKLLLDLAYRDLAVYEKAIEDIETSLRKVLTSTLPESMKDGYLIAIGKALAKWKG